MTMYVLSVSFNFFLIADQQTKLCGYKSHVIFVFSAFPVLLLALLVR